MLFPREVVLDFRAPLLRPRELDDLLAPLRPLELDLPARPRPLVLLLLLPRLVVLREVLPRELAPRELEPRELDPLLLAPLRDDDERPVLRPRPEAADFFFVLLLLLLDALLRVVFRAPPVLRPFELLRVLLLRPPRLGLLAMTDPPVMPHAFSVYHFGPRRASEIAFVHATSNSSFKLPRRRHDTVRKVFQSIRRWSASYPVEKFDRVQDRNLRRLADLEHAADVACSDHVRARALDVLNFALAQTFRNVGLQHVVRAG